MGRAISSNLVIGALGVLATVLTGLLTVYAVYDLHGRGDAPPHRLEASYTPATDPLGDLTSRDRGLTITVRRGNVPIENLRVIQTSLTNEGQSPIIPGDYAEPLSITTTAPWKIVNIVNTYGQSDIVRLTWEKVSDNEFRAAPALLNPGDMVAITVYLTHPNPSLSSRQQVPTIRWGGRIVNLPSIHTAPNPFENGGNPFGWIFVTIWGWGVALLVASFSLYLSLTALLLDRARIIRTGSTFRYGWLVLASLLNLSAAEAGTTLVFGLTPIVELPAPLFENVTPLILNAIMLVGLFIYSRRRGSRTAKGNTHPA